MDDVKTPSLHNFSIEEFRQATKAMVATREDAYNLLRGSTSIKPLREYDENKIQQIIESGTIAAQQDLSYNYFCIDGFYKRIILYYTTLLKYYGILIPIYNNSSSSSSDHKRYMKALHFLNKINIQELSINFMNRALIYGCYYGLIQNIGEDFVSILDLPPKYCSSKFKDEYGNDIIEFDLHYFDTILLPNMKKAALEAYPKIITKAYEKFHNNKGPRYILIPSEIGICFSCFSGRPFFIHTLPDIGNYRDYKRIEKRKDSNAIKKIIVQKIPHLNDGTLLFEPDEAVVMHSGAVEMMAGNEDVDILTTYGDIDTIDSQGTNETVSKNNLEKIAQSVYRSAGVSAQLFAATGNMALTSSLQNDLSFCMYMANKFAHFYSYLINTMFKNKNISFNYKFLSISYYNEKEYLDNVFKGATYGYSLILPSIAMGINQLELENLKELENNVLQLNNKLIPLKSSYTESSSNDGGRPVLEDTQKTSKTIANIEAK